MKVVLAYIELGRREGAKLVAGGQRDVEHAAALVDRQRCGLAGGAEQREAVQAVARWLDSMLR
jgi:hypothetical protein